MTSRVLALLLLIVTTTVNARPIQIDGEIVANRTTRLSPPAVQEVWELTIAELVAEGSTVAAGDVVLRFEVGDLSKALLESQNKLAEQTRVREQLLLTLAGRERTETLSVAEARAELEKAQRKATQPQDAIRSLDYRKLVVERARAERRMALQERHERFARQQRLAELQLLDDEVRRLREDVERLTAEIEALNVKAPVAGTLVHRSTPQGERFAAGSAVWKGVVVAEIPDNASLAVRASLPERELLNIAVGAVAQVHVDTAAAVTLPARVVRIGAAITSKSRFEPYPIVDLYLEFDGKAAGVRLGQQVRVEIDAPEHKPVGCKAS